MGLGEILSDLYNLVTFTDVYAEAPQEEAEESEEAQEGGEEESGESSESSEDAPDSESVEGGEVEEEAEEEKEEEEEEEEEEAEEEEPEDIKPKLEEGMKVLLFFFVFFYHNSIQLAYCLPPFNCSLQSTHLLRPIPPCPLYASSYRYPITNLTVSGPNKECAHSVQCASVKHHYDECAERVTAQQSNPDHKGPKEDCLEECQCSRLFRFLLFVNLSSFFFPLSSILLRSYLHLLPMATTT